MNNNISTTTSEKKKSCMDGIPDFRKPPFQHVILHAKGWYINSEMSRNENLEKLLELDGCFIHKNDTPEKKRHDIARILLSAYDDIAKRFVKYPSDQYMKKEIEETDKFENSMFGFVTEMMYNARDYRFHGSKKEMTVEDCVIDTIIGRLRFMEIPYLDKPVYSKDFPFRMNTGKDLSIAEMNEAASKFWDGIETKNAETCHS